MLVTTMPTPAGPFTILASRAGAVRAAGFATGVDELLARVHPDLRGDPRPCADLGPVTAAVASYLDGRPAAVRAAAQACARNAPALFVPCHRVLRTDGGLGGYRWGLDVKKWLLGHERRLPITEV